MPIRKEAMVDQATRNQRVLKYHRLVHYVVRRAQRHDYYINQMDYDDAIQVAQLALMRAAELYDDQHSSRAQEITYYSHSMFMALIREASRYRVVHPSDHVYRRMHKVGMTLAEIHYLGNIDDRGCEQNDEVWEPEDQVTHPGLTSDRQAILDIDVGLEQLEPEEQVLIRNHFGYGARHLIGRAIGKKLGITRYTVTKRTKLALAKLRRLVLGQTSK